MQYILHEEEAAEQIGPDQLLPGADPKCFICRAAIEGDERRRRVLRRGEHAVALLNRYPYNNGHLLVAPLRHVASLDQLGPEAEFEISRTITQMVGLLERVMQPQGFNIGLNLGRAAGAGLPGHLHWHIVPRWIGDTNFMPILAATNTIPQSLDALWELLAAELKSQGKRD
jgi:ATP adenylyltransferase